MEQEHDWQYDLDEYIRQGEPDRSEKSAAWQTAIGLQDVDGLQTSEYLLETAKEHIEGKIDISTAQKRIYSYYEQRDVRMTVEQDTMEADIVAAHIAELLAEKTFQFSPAELQLYIVDCSQACLRRLVSTGPITSLRKNGCLTVKRCSMQRLTASVILSTMTSVRRKRSPMRNLM